LVEETGAGPRAVWDLAVGAAAAWLRPTFTSAPGERVRLRLQAGLSATWVAWRVGMLAVPVVARALLDPPVPGATGTVRTLVRCAWLVLLAGGVLAAGSAIGVTATLSPLAVVQTAAVLLAGDGLVAVGGATIAVLAAGGALVSTRRMIPALRMTLRH